MGSTPIQLVELDLDGNGSMVDVTAYVDMPSGIQHSYGRGDWTAAEPDPGTLAFTLDNVGGRFTPGHTVDNGGTYIVGLRRGVNVRWTCGGRVRLFVVTAAELDFTAGTIGGSTVAVACLDALAQLVKYKLRSLLSEHVLSARPVLYYPLAESASSDPATTVAAIDISGHNRPPLVPNDNPLTVIGWGDGIGPRTDGAATPIFRPDDIAPTLQNDTLVYNRTGSNGGPLAYEYRPVGNASADFDPYRSGTNSPQDMALGVSFWFNIRNIYPAPGSGAYADGPYVALVRLEGGTAKMRDVNIVWRVEDRSILLFFHGDGYSSVARLSSTSYTVSPTDTHHLQIVFRFNQTAPFNIVFQGALDGVQLASGTASFNAPWRPAAVPLATVGGIGGIYPYGDKMKGGQGANTDCYALSGSIAHVAVFGPPDVELPGSAATSPAVMARPLFAADQWAIGQLGVPERADKRFSRLGTFYDGAIFESLGEPQQSPLGRQEIDGQTLLTALCVALRGEGAQIYAEATADGVGYVRTEMDSLQRVNEPRLTVNAEYDASGLPTFAFDESGAVTVAIVTGSAGIEVSYNADPSVGANDIQSVTIETAMQDINLLTSYAQFRTLQGRPGFVIPSAITVDASTSESALTVTLLDDMRPGNTVAIVGLPLSIVGYSELSCTIVGVSETHNTQGSLFTLALTPRFVSSNLDTTGRFQFESDASQVTIVGGDEFDTVTAGGTTFDLLTSSTTGATLTTDAADYPLLLRIAAEIVSLGSPPSSPTADGGNWRQALTGVTRGALGTTAASHAGLDAQTLALVDGDGNSLLDLIISF